MDRIFALEIKPFRRIRKWKKNETFFHYLLTAGYNVHRFSFFFAKIKAHMKINKEKRREGKRKGNYLAKPDLIFANILVK
jgi:CRISPR/Cas system-associated protein endoribonuclease Cas2